MPRDGETLPGSGVKTSVQSYPAVSEVVCSFCGAEPGLVKKIIAGPKGFYICEECVGLTAPAAASGSASSSRTTLLRDATTAEYGQIQSLAAQLQELLAKAQEDAEACCFCQKRFRLLLRPASTPGVTICLECIDLCIEVVEDEISVEDDQGERSPE